MTTLTDSTPPSAMRERTHTTMTIPTCTEAVSPAVTRAALVSGGTYLCCSICCGGPGLHLRGHATGSRDAP